MRSAETFRPLIPAAVRRAVERLAYRRAAPILPEGLDGLGMYAPGDWPDLYAEGYEPELAQALRRLTRPGMSCADVGAHLGYHTLLIAALAGPSGHVVAVEADAVNARTVARSVALNGLEGRVEVLHAAATRVDGARVSLYGGRGGEGTEWTTSATFAAREDGRRRRAAASVPGISLDARFEAGERLELVKIDVEGGEGDVLAGARRVLAEARPVVVLEFHREAGWPAIASLLDAGYGLRCLDGTALPPPAGPDDVPYHLVAHPG